MQLRTRVIHCNKQEAKPRDVSKRPRKNAVLADNQSLEEPVDAMNVRHVTVRDLSVRIREDLPLVDGQTADAYAAFLWCKIFRPKTETSPGPVVDELWHAHVLDTRVYAAFFSYFGVAFVHHSPAGASEEQDSARELRYMAFLALLVTTGHEDYAETVRKVNQDVTRVALIDDGPLRGRMVPFATEADVIHCVKSAMQRAGYNATFMPASFVKKEGIVRVLGCIPWKSLQVDAKTPGAAIITVKTLFTCKPMVFGFMPTDEDKITAFLIALAVQNHQLIPMDQQKLIVDGKRLDIKSQDAVAPGTTVHLVVNLSGC